MSVVTEDASPLWAPRLVALDVDGTLITYRDFHAPPAPAVLEAVERARRAGVHAVVATGRSLHSTYPIFDALGLENGFAVCSNGAVVVDVATRQPIDVVTFDALDPVRYFAEQIPDAVLAVEELGVGFRISGDNVNFEFDGQVDVVPHDELVQGPVTRLVVRWPEGDRDRLKAIAAEMGLPAVDYAIGYTAWLDIMPAGVTKAEGLDKVCFRLGVAPEEVLAFGDGHNDMAMLAWAGRGVAMGNAPDDVKAVADEVAPHVDEDGVAVVLDRYLGGTTQSRLDGDDAGLVAP
jgi:Cof subfamily protein (haloacid dehalogenase superfamily)